MTAAAVKGFNTGKNVLGGYNYERFLRENAADLLKELFPQALKAKLTPAVETVMGTIGTNMHALRSSRRSRRPASSFPWSAITSPRATWSRTCT
jgi:hypothetical protein